MNKDAMHSTRLIFATAVIAAFLAFVQNKSIILPWIGPFFYVASFVLGIASIFAFLYLLVSAALVKTQRPGRLDYMTVTESQRDAFYDISVSIFGFVPAAILYGAIMYALSDLTLAARLGLAALAFIIFNLGGSRLLQAIADAWMKMEREREKKTTWFRDALNTRVIFGAIVLTVAGYVSLHWKS